MWFHEASRECEDVRYLGEGLGNSLRAFYDEGMNLLAYYLDLADPIIGPSGVGDARFIFGREEMAALIREVGEGKRIPDGDLSIDEMTAILTEYAKKNGFNNLHHAARCNCKDWEC